MFLSLRYRKACQHLTFMVFCSSRWLANNSCKRWCWIIANGLCKDPGKHQYLLIAPSRTSCECLLVAHAKTRPMSTISSCHNSVHVRLQSMSRLKIFLRRLGQCPLIVYARTPVVLVVPTRNRPMFGSKPCDDLLMLANSQYKDTAYQGNLCKHLSFGSSASTV